MAEPMKPYSTHEHTVDYFWKFPTNYMDFSGRSFGKLRNDTVLDFVNFPIFDYIHSIVNPLINGSGVIL